MANEKVGNILYVNDTSSQVNLVIPNIKIKKIVLSNASTPAAVTLQVADYDASSPRVIAQLKISSSELSKVFDFEDNPIALPNGLAIPASGLTSNASATIIYEGR